LTSLPAGRQVNWGAFEALSTCDLVTLSTFFKLVNQLTSLLPNPQKYFHDTASSLTLLKTILQW